MFDSWSWANNPNDVKSYSNAVYNFTKSQLSDVTSMQSTFDWSYTGDSVVADVSYDLFTSSTVDGTEEYEIMIWLAALGGAGTFRTKHSHPLQYFYKLIIEGRSNQRLLQRCRQPRSYRHHDSRRSQLFPLQGHQWRPDRYLLFHRVGECYQLQWRYSGLPHLPH